MMSFAFWNSITERWREVKFTIIPIQVSDSKEPTRLPIKGQRKTSNSGRSNNDRNHVTLKHGTRVSMMRKGFEYWLSLIVLGVSAGATLFVLQQTFVSSNNAVANSSEDSTATDSNTGGEKKKTSHGDTNNKSQLSLQQWTFSYFQSFCALSRNMWSFWRHTDIYRRWKCLYRKHECNRIHYSCLWQTLWLLQLAQENPICNSLTHLLLLWSLGECLHYLGNETTGQDDCDSSKYGRGNTTRNNRRDCQSSSFQVRNPNNRNKDFSLNDLSNEYEVPLNDADNKEKSDNAKEIVDVSASSSLSSMNDRYLEILVHNVSHTDMILGLQSLQQQSEQGEVVSADDLLTSLQFQNPEGSFIYVADADKSEQAQQVSDDANKDEENKSHKETRGDDNKENFILCRPRFSYFAKYSQLVMKHLNANSDPLVYLPRYERSVDSPRYSIKHSPSGSTIAAGFEFQKTSVDNDFVARECDVRVRGRDQKMKELNNICTAKNTSHGVDCQEDDECDNATFPISHVFFPLLATLLPQWKRRIIDKRYPYKVKRVLVLVTGVGTPRNWSHSVDGNSTQHCADLMEQFVKRIDPHLTVVKIHSTTNIFRYDENLVFAEKELLPIINSYRDAHAQGQPYPDELERYVTLPPKTPFDTEWRQSTSLTLSFADGSNARTHAIQASLRPYRPTYFHFWQLKTFWHETKIVDDDIEVHSFEAMETTPAVDVDQVEHHFQKLVIEEMRHFRDEIYEMMEQDALHDLHTFWLRKTHKPVLAVLLVQLSDKAPPKLYRGTNMEVSMPTGSLCAERNVIGTALAMNPGLKREHLKCIAVLAVPWLKLSKEIVHSGSSLSLASSTADLRKGSIGSEGDESMTNNQATGDWTTAKINDHLGDEHAEKVITDKPLIDKLSPLRWIDLVGGKNSTNNDDNESIAHRRSKRKFVVQGKDSNPLRPCGSCNEWLKKIAESNPYFKVLTFTDADLNGVYCASCQE